MSAQAIYRRWRPQHFDDVIGQDHITQTLRKAVQGDRLAHAYLFTGPRGTGKTSVARILAKAACCRDEDMAARPCNDCAICLSMTAGRALDLIEIDAASNTGVDDVRDLRDKIGFSPNEARYKVYIIDEVHMLSTAAFNALLKTLEEPPPHALFIMATTEPHKIPDTILSRCQRHDFRRVDLAAVTAKLARICQAEEADAEPDALEMIARSGTGSIRDAESLLDQMLASGETITVDAVREVLGTPADEAVIDLVDAILAGDAAAGLALINAALDRGADPRQLQDRLLEHLRGLLLIHTGLEADLLHQPDERLAVMREQAAALPMRALVRSIHRFNEARPGANRALPSLPMELALVETVIGLAASEEITEPAPPAAASSDRSATRSKPAQQPAGKAGSTADAERPADTAETDGSTSKTSSEVGTDAGPKASSGDAPSKTADATSARKASKSKEAAASPTEVSSTSDPEPSTAATSTSQAGNPSDPGGPDAVVDLEALRKRWSAALRAVEARDRNLAALLKDCRPIASGPEGLTLGFFYEFHCRRASQPEKSRLIADAIQSVLGQPVRLRCTVVSESEAEAARRPRSKSDQAAQDPVVKHALDTLGAQITGVQDPEPDDDED